MPDLNLPCAKGGIIHVNLVLLLPDIFLSLLCLRSLWSFFKLTKTELQIPLTMAMEVVKGSDFSDGDATHRPDPEKYSPIDPKPLLQSVAFKWVVENSDDAQTSKFSWTTAIETLLVILMSSLIGWNSALGD